MVQKAGVRSRVDINQLDNFVNFITSPYIVQDLPFWRAVLEVIFWRGNSHPKRH